MAKKSEITVVAEPHKIVGQEENTRLINLAVELNESVLLIGETGTGKTSIIKDIAEKNEREWVRFNLTGETTVDEFVGKYILINGETIWQDGVLLQAMKKGMWLICDEINAALPEILFVLHSLLDDDKHVMVANHNGEIVSPHEHFRFFATMNPVDEYAGTKELNKAFKSRFGMILYINTPDEKIEVQILQKRCGLELANARMIVMVANKLRQMKVDQKIYLTVSTRDLIQWGMLGKHATAADAFMATILNKADSAEERETIGKAVQSVVGNISSIVKNGNKELDPEWFDKEMTKLSQARAKEAESFRGEMEAQREQIANEERAKIINSLSTTGRY
jgi:midasin (ATPase involved in ribosome maturation)